MVYWWPNKGNGLYQLNSIVSHELVLDDFWIAKYWISVSHRSNIAIRSLLYQRTPKKRIVNKQVRAVGDLEHMIKVARIAAELRVAAINVGYKPRYGRYEMEKMAGRRKVELTPAKFKLMDHGRT